MLTNHLIRFDDAQKMNDVATRSVHLVVTSPPYPMIKMWDALFCRQPAAREAMDNRDGMRAFELMHRQLDRVWEELYRVLVPGGIACINIGDAARTMDGRFSLYPNHSRILSRMLDLGFSNLPNILWRKQTNAPNKFMGSGMMPPGAYVTLEHEHILIFRKGDRRLFNTRPEKTNRRQSAFFWEERNQWFSDVWMDLKGARQKTADKQLRQRSGAYPFELPYRLISMFSVMGDTVLDPFLGSGTTLFAAATAGRNSLGYELDDAFGPVIEAQWEDAMEQGRQRIARRFENHRLFIRDREAAGKAVRHINAVYGFPVITRQESELTIPLPVAVQQTQPNRFSTTYDRPEAPADGQSASVPTASPSGPTGQLALFE